MKIMYVVSDDIQRNTSANIRNTSLIRGLLDCGHKVQIVCMHQKAPIDRGLTDAVRGSKVTYINSLETGQGSRPQSGIGGGLKGKIKRTAVKLYNLVRIYDPNIWKVRAIKLNPNMFDMPDIIISSSDPRSSHVLAIRIRKCINFNGVYVQYWGDPMMNDISASDLVRGFLRAAERHLLHSANLVVYTNEAVRAYICQCYKLAKEKTTSIPTSCAITHTAAREQDYNEGMIRLGYFGAYYCKTRNIKPLFGAILDNPKLHLTIAGTGDHEVPTDERIKIYPMVSAQMVAELQENVDILIVVENIPKITDKDKCFQIPGKVYHYGVTDKKVLVICETGIINTSLSRYERFAFCENTAEAIGKEIIRLYCNKEPQLSKPVSDFLPKNVAEKLVKSIMGVRL